MSIHKLSAGSGYDYLTRQVAALDATEKGHIGLASYYTERGESPGSWIGSGMAGIDGVNAGDPVTAEQMRALFGAGMHPLAAERLEQLEAADSDRRKHQGSDPAGCAVQGLRRRCQPVPGRGGEADCRAAGGADSRWTSRSRRQLGRGSAPRWRGSSSVAEHGRDPIDAREIAAIIAKHVASADPDGCRL